MMNNKSQAVSEVFMFILSAIVFVLILLYGYNAITSVLATKDKVMIGSFKSSLEAATAAIRPSYGSERTLELAIPERFLEFCAADPHMSAIHAGLFQQQHGLMYSAWRTTSTNTIFFRPLLETSIHLDQIAVFGPLNPTEPGFVCTNITRGKLFFRIRGLGDKTEIFI